MDAFQFFRRAAPVALHDQRSRPGVPGGRREVEQVAAELAPHTEAERRERDQVRQRVRRRHDVGRRHRRTAHRARDPRGVAGRGVDHRADRRGRAGRQHDLDPVDAPAPVPLAPHAQAQRGRAGGGAHPQPGRSRRPHPQPDRVPARPQADPGDGAQVDRHAVVGVQAEPHAARERVVRAARREGAPGGAPDAEAQRARAGTDVDRPPAHHAAAAVEDGHHDRPPGAPSRRAARTTRSRAACGSAWTPTTACRST